MITEFQAGASPLPGYRLIQPRGRWAGAERWEADGPEGDRVVVRLIRLARPLSDEQRRALESLCRLQGPHLWPLLAAIEADGVLGLVTPLFDRTLADRLAECQAAGLPGVPPAELAGHLRGMATALDTMFQTRPESGVPGGHGDVRPENLVLLNGAAALTDAGIAALVPEAVGSEAGSAALWYTAPERFRGQVTPEADQYALAATFAHLRLGRPPFPGSTMMMVMHAHLTDLPDLAGLPDLEAALIKRALAKDPAWRWPSALAFAEAWSPALESAASAVEPGTEVAIPGSAGPLAGPSAPPRTRKRSGHSKVRIKTGGAEPEPDEALFRPTMAKGLAVSLVLHGLLLLVLAFWFFSTPSQDIRAIDTTLAGDLRGDESGSSIRMGGEDAPLTIDPVQGSPTDTPLNALAPTTLGASSLTTLPVGDVQLDPAAALRIASGGSGPGQGGGLGGEGFGMARFGTGTENVHGVQIKVGDPQFTLIWNSDVDLDLHVLEPGGSEIYWQSPKGRRGGELDVDDVDGHGPENVYWIQGKGPPGEYRWFVHYFGGLRGFSTTTEWVVRIKHNGQIIKEKGILKVPGQRSKVYTLRVEASP